jgi:hypothetical protein
MIALGRNSLAPEETERRNWRITFHRNDLLPVERRRISGFLDFVAVLDVSDRCSASLMRNSNSSVPPVQLENPLSWLGSIESLPRQANGSHGVYAEQNGFCLTRGAFCRAMSTPFCG